jgi:hypothetical protein
MGHMTNPISILSRMNINVKLFPSLSSSQDDMSFFILPTCIVLLVFVLEVSRNLFFPELMEENIMASDQRERGHIVRVCFAMLATSRPFIRNDGSPRHSTPRDDTGIYTLTILKEAFPNPESKKEPGEC